jgi:hypothetical protein
MTGEADGDLKVYVNGNEDGYTAFSGNLMINAKPFQIGQHHEFPNRFFKGTIDEVHIYNRSLTQSEIQEEMECGTGNLSGFIIDTRTGGKIGMATAIVLPGQFRWRKIL